MAKEIDELKKGKENLKKESKQSKSEANILLVKTNKMMEENKDMTASLKAIKN